MGIYIIMYSILSFIKLEFAIIMYMYMFVRDMVGWVILLSFLSYFFKLVCYAHVFPCTCTCTYHDFYTHTFLTLNYCIYMHALKTGKKANQKYCNNRH